MPKILVVDDEPILHRLLQHHLVNAGYQVVDAKNGREALELASKEIPDVIVMDVMMAELDGLTTLRRLKKDEALKKIPVIVVTANPHNVSAHESEVAGAEMFLTKPFSPQQLLGAIRKLVPIDPAQEDKK